MHPNENEITWENFKEGFRGAHIPKSVMKIKKKEFDELKQRAMTVSEYNSQFTLLSRYANEERMTESKKMEKFLEGLAPALKCQLVVHTFPDFKTLVDKAITLENERRSLEDFRKRKRDQTTFARNHRSKKEFQKGKHTKPRRIIHAQSRISMQGARSSHIAQALLVTHVEKKGTMPSNAPSQETQPRSLTMVAIIQRQSETISTPITTTGMVT